MILFLSASHSELSELPAAFTVFHIISSYNFSSIHFSYGLRIFPYKFTMPSFFLLHRHFGIVRAHRKKSLFKQKYLSNVAGKKWRGTCQFEISFYLTFQLTSSTFEFSTCSILPPEIQMFPCSISSSASRLYFYFFSFFYTSRMVASVLYSNEYCSRRILCVSYCIFICLLKDNVSFSPNWLWIHS